MSDKLPTGWTTAPLGTLTRPNRPRVNPQDHRHLPFVGMEQVEAHTRRLLGTLPASDFKSSAFHFQPGDVLYGRLRPYLNKVLLANFEGLCSSEFIVLPPTGMLEPSYLAYYLSNNEFVNFANQLNQGDRPRVNFDQLAEHKIPFPPLAEQRRIVAKLEALLSKIDGCKDRLAKIPIILKRFRQSVLAAACSGRLTADWREKKGPIESARALLDRIQSPSPEPYLDIFERTSKGEIPDTWVWTPLGKLGRLMGGGTPTKDNASYWNGAIPWVSPKDMKRDRICDSEDHVAPIALEQTSVRLIPKGSILFVVRGMILNHTLPIAITDQPITLNQDMKALIPELPEMAEYLFLASKHLAPQILFEVKEATHGTRRIETPLLKNWAIPIPPLSEQREIIRRVRRLFALADTITIRYAKASDQIGGLAPAILAKAFRAELVITEAELAKIEGRDFESATELLRRIQGSGEQNGATRPEKVNSKHARSKVGHF